MIDSILFDKNGLVYLPRLISSDKNYWRSKLAFREGECLEADDRIEICASDKFAVDLVNKQIMVPSSVGERALCYLTRVATDYLLTLRGVLPLHAAAVSLGNWHILVFAKPGGGKSRLSELICGAEPAARVIGDDHIVIFDKYIQGNLSRRLRNLTVRGEHYKRNTGYANRKKTLAVCYDPQSCSQNTCRPLNMRDWFRKIEELTAFKYLCSNFLMNDFCYDIKSLFGKEVISNYHGSAAKIIDAEKRLLISGTQIEAVEVIRSFVH